MKRQKRNFARAICLSLALSSTIFSAASAYAAPALGDYDGDGTSDLAAVEINRAAQNTFFYVVPTPSKPAIGFNFGAAADALVTGEYYKNDPRTYPGIVRVLNQFSPLNWIIKAPGGGENSILFGSPGDIVPNQSDLDCDGVTDFVVTRAGSPTRFAGFKLWYVGLSANPGVVQEMLFGLAGDTAGTADMDGDGCSEMVLLRGSDYTWYSRKLFDDTVTAKQWGLAGDVGLLPHDLNNDGAADYTVTRNINGRLTAISWLSNGTAQLVTLGNPTAVALTGNFTGVSDFAWLERATSFIGVRQQDGSAAVFPFSKPSNYVVRPDGTVIQPITGEATAGPRCDAQIRRNDGSGGFKNNPKNSRGTVKVMFPKIPFTGNIRAVKAYAPNGAFLEQLGEGSTLEWGERERYYGRRSLGSYPKNLLILVEMNDGRNFCTTLEDPTKVYE